MSMPVSVEPVSVPGQGTCVMFFVAVGAGPAGSHAFSGVSEHSFVAAPVCDRSGALSRQFTAAPAALYSRRLATAHLWSASLRLTRASAPAPHMVAGW